MTYDASDFLIFAEVARESANHVIAQTKRSVTRGAVNVKNQLRADANGSRSFRQVGSTVNFDIESDSTSTEASIGPNKQVGTSASLAGIAYFGTSKPGGGTLPDPVKALEAEAAKFESAIGDILTEVFG
jgi:hypothetical protein